MRGQVSGNPYNITPLNNIRVPLNATFRLPIKIYNPHSRALFVDEIATSDVNIHIEMDKFPLTRFASSNIWVIKISIKQLSFYRN